VPPESPRFLQVPDPPQWDDPKKQIRRGHLPIPRAVFHNTKGSRKLTAEYLERTAPVSQAEQRGEAPRSANQAWTRLMAASRREGLAAGLQGLWKRREVKKRRESQRAQHNAKINRTAALHTPERAADVLTRPTVRDSTAKVTAVAPDPHRFDRAAASAAKTAALTQFKSESRRDALMELYVASANFIVDEAELARTVDELFTDDHLKKKGNTFGLHTPDSIWEAKGPPHTPTSMLIAMTRKSNPKLELYRPEMDRAALRQKLIAEALTGGKIPT